MVKISLKNKEIVQVMDLAESFVPGLDLTPLRSMFSDLKLEGNVNVTKTFDGESLTVAVEIQKDGP